MPTDSSNNEGKDLPAKLPSNDIPLSNEEAKTPLTPTSLNSAATQSNGTSMYTSSNTIASASQVGNDDDTVVPSDDSESSQNASLAQNPLEGSGQEAYYSAVAFTNHSNETTSVATSGTDAADASSLEVNRETESKDSLQVLSSDMESANPKSNGCNGETLQAEKVFPVENETNEFVENTIAPSAMPGNTSVLDENNERNHTKSVSNDAKTGNGVQEIMPEHDTASCLSSTSPVLHKGVIDAAEKPPFSGDMPQSAASKEEFQTEHEGSSPSSDLTQAAVVEEVHPRSTPDTMSKVSDTTSEVQENVADEMEDARNAIDEDVPLSVVRNDVNRTAISEYDAPQQPPQNEKSWFYSFGGSFLSGRNGNNKGPDNTAEGAAEEIDPHTQTIETSPVEKVVVRSRSPDIREDLTNSPTIEELSASDQSTSNQLTSNPEAETSLVDNTNVHGQPARPSAQHHVATSAEVGMHDQDTKPSSPSSITVRDSIGVETSLVDNTNVHGQPARPSAQHHVATSAEVGMHNQDTKPSSPSSITVKDSIGVETSLVDNTNIHGQRARPSSQHHEATSAEVGMHDQDTKPSSPSSITVRDSIGVDGRAEVSAVSFTQPTVSTGHANDAIQEPRTLSEKPRLSIAANVQQHSLISHSDEDISNSAEYGESRHDVVDSVRISPIHADDRASNGDAALSKRELHHLTTATNLKSKKVLHGVYSAPGADAETNSFSDQNRDSQEAPTTSYASSINDPSTTLSSDTTSEISDPERLDNDINELKDTSESGSQPKSWLSSIFSVVGFRSPNKQHANNGQTFEARDTAAASTEFSNTEQSSILRSDDTAKTQSSSSARETDSENIAGGDSPELAEVLPATTLGTAQSRNAPTRDVTSQRHSELSTMGSTSTVSKTNQREREPKSGVSQVQSADQKHALKEMAATSKSLDLSTNSVPSEDAGIEGLVVLKDDDITNIRSALLRSPFLNGLDNDQVEQFLQSAKLKTFQANRIVVLEDCIYDDEDRHHDSDTQTFAADKSKQRRNGERNYNRPFQAYLTSLEGQSDDVGAFSDIQRRGTFGIEETHWSVPPSTLKEPSFIYIIRSGKAEAVCSSTSSKVQLKSGQMFGERSALFRQPHSVTVTSCDDGPLECWVVDRKAFFDRVLPSSRQDKYFISHQARPDSPLMNETKTNEHQEGGIDSYLRLEDFVKASIASSQTGVDGIGTPWTPWMSASLAATFRALTNNEYRDDPSKISLDDFCMLLLLQRSGLRQGEDLAYLAMKNETRDYISRIDFERFLENLHRNQPWFFLSADSRFLQRYFGISNNASSQADFHQHRAVSRFIHKENFSELWKDLQREMARQAFDKAVGGKSFLLRRDFYQILASTMAWKLPYGVLDRLSDLLNNDEDVDDDSSNQQNVIRKANQQASGLAVTESTSQETSTTGKVLLFNRLVGYHDLISFREALEQLPSFCDLVQRAHQLKRGAISLDDCAVSNQTYGSGLSPFQIQILFHLFDTNRDGFISTQDTIDVLGWDPTYRLERTKDGALTMTYSDKGYPRRWLTHGWGDDSTTFLGQTRAYAEQIALITLTGGFAAFSTYPFDLLKTRMMNQQSHQFAWRLYTSSIDCFVKTFRVEGVLGLYGGLLPQLLGAGPEKIIKMAVNDTLRDAFTEEQSPAELHTQWWLEVLTGGCAGACQVLVTNPMEVAKIQLQIQGETRNVYMAQGRQVSSSAQTLSAIAARLGLAGHYRGVAACLLRDVPFGAIFFPTFTLCKDTLFQYNRDCSDATNLILAGSIAAVPACLITNPADVIKTRLQVLRRDDHTAYIGIRDGFVKLYQQEGLSAFFKGWLPRMLRTVPQFGITAWSYEYLSRGLKLQNHASPPTDAPIPPQEFRAAFR